MQVTYDATGDVLYIQWSDAPQVHGEPVPINIEDGEGEPDEGTILHYDADGRAVALELIGASERIPRERLEPLSVTVTVHPDQRLQRSLG